MSYLGPVTKEYLRRGWIQCGDCRREVRIVRHEKASTRGYTTFHLECGHSVNIANRKPLLSQEEIDGVAKVTGLLTLVLGALGFVLAATGSIEAATIVWIIAGAFFAVFLIFEIVLGGHSW